jgi:formylglycine-generating enzyme required for sulfatase activity
MYTSKLYPAGSFDRGKTYDGCYDMAGNVEEFCSDLFELYIYKTYKENEPVYNPSDPDSNLTGQRSLRGTFTIFHHDYEIEKQITTFRRMACMPEDYYQFYGFRIVKNIN